MSERVAENLNRAIHQAMANDPSVFFIGEDVMDPYGGAFRISKGLSTAFGDRVIGTPISEQAIVGMANGLALTGQKPIVEVMFGDFIFLAFDQIVNFAAKSVSMYGHPFPMRLLVRCPVGGQRGYGPTHSQSVQKFFIGVPNLTLCELSPLHDNRVWLPWMLNQPRPGILFESKTLYPQPQYHDGHIDEAFEYDYLDPKGMFARCFIEQDIKGKILLIAPGGMVPTCLNAGRELLLKHEVEVQIVTPFQLYPFNPEPLHPLLEQCAAVYIVEESTPGGTWGQEVRAAIHESLRGKKAPPIRLIQSKNCIIPTARHLEKYVLIQSDVIVRYILKDGVYATDHHSND